MKELLPLTLSAHRHQIVRRALDQYTADAVLDVGGYTYRGRDPQTRRLNVETLRVLGVAGGIRSYRSVNMETDYDQERIPDVTYAGQTLPFEDRSVAAVTAIDVLEHVAQPDRERFLNESARVAAQCALILFPHNSPATNEFEEGQLAGLREMGISARLSLLEHRKFGLPDADEMADIMEGLGYRVTVTHHTPLEVIVPYHDEQLAILTRRRRGELSRIGAQEALVSLKRGVETRLSDWTGELDLTSAYRTLLAIEEGGGEQ